MMLLYEAYVAVCLVTSGTWAYIGQKWTRKTLALVVFFPGIFIAWFGEEASFPSRVIGFGKFNINLQFSVLGGLLAMLTISLSLFVTWLTGWGKVDERANFEGDASNPLTIFLSAVAEELGWRCYLLPLLTQQYDMIPAILISSVITGLYHVPMMCVMAWRHKHPHPLLSVVLIFLHRCLFSVPTCWLAIRTGYCIWAPVMMLFTWCRINPVTTGDFYSNKPAKVRGPLWRVSAQGVAGCLGLIPILIFIVYQVQWKM